MVNETKRTATHDRGTHMFMYLLIACVLAALFHGLRQPERSRERLGELLLLYVLVGYCGFPMLAVSVGILVAPDRMAEMLPIGASGAVVAFFGWAYLGMSLLSLLALRYRGAYLIGPAVCWAVYFAGATFVHLHGAGAPASHGGMLAIFATHGLVTVLLVTGILMSGLLGRHGERAGP